MKREYSESRRRANDKWLKNNYKRISFAFPIDVAEQFKAKCEAVGKSQRQVIMEKVDEFINDGN